MKSSQFRGTSLIEKLVALSVMLGLAVLIMAAVNRLRLKDRQQAATCLSNLKQLSLAVNLYVQDNGTYPAMLRVVKASKTAKSGVGVYWNEILAPYVKSPQIFHCPTSNRFRTATRIHDEYAKTNYWFNGTQLGLVNPERGTGYIGKPKALVPHPELTLMNMESVDTVAVPTSDDQNNYIPVRGMGREVPTACDHETMYGAIYHQHGGNYSFADGHVKWLTPESLAEAWCQTYQDRLIDAQRRKKTHP